jgi:large subunit ribosomal protein L29
MRELKAEKIRDMTEEEIETKVRELHEEIFNLRFRNAMRQLQNPLLIRERKRDIARLRTILVEHRTGVRKLGDHAVPHAPAMPRDPMAVKDVKEPKAAKAVKEPKAAKAVKEPKAAGKAAKAAKESKK